MCCGRRDIGRKIRITTLYEYRERIQCGGEYISREDFGAMMDPVAAALEEMKRAGEEQPSPFEIETALSFLYFKEKECSPVLLECGMGGQNDATNVITTTELAVLTSVSMDHMEYLGGTLGEIAAQKAGIIKPGSSAVTCRQLPEAEKEIENACRRLDVPLTVADCSQAEVYEAGIRCTRFSWGGHTVTIHLPGAHQLQNAVVALAESMRCEPEAGRSERNMWPGGLPKPCGMAVLPSSGSVPGLFWTARIIRTRQGNFRSPSECTLQENV